MTPISPLIKGVITGALMVIASLMFYYLKLPQQSPLHYLIYVFFTAGILWTLISYSRSASYNGSFIELFGQGFRCFIIIIVIMVAFTSIFTLLHPEFAEESAKFYREDLLKKGNNTPQQIEEIVGKAKKQYTTTVVSLTIFGYLIIGTIITAAGSVFLMRRK